MDLDRQSHIGRRSTTAGNGRTSPSAVVAALADRALCLVFGYRCIQRSQRVAASISSKRRSLGRWGSTRLIMMLFSRLAIARARLDRSGALGLPRSHENARNTVTETGPFAAVER